MEVIFHSSYVTLALNSTLVLEVIWIIWHAEVVSSSSFVIVASPSSSSRVDQLSSLVTGAVCPPPANEGGPSCWWALGSLFPLRPRQAGVSTQTRLPHWPLGTRNSGQPLWSGYSLTPLRSWWPYLSLSRSTATNLLEVTKPKTCMYIYSNTQKWLLVQYEIPIHVSCLVTSTCTYHGLSSQKHNQSGNCWLYICTCSCICMHCHTRKVRLPSLPFPRPFRPSRPFL